MAELSDTSSILQAATSSSFVILDELGRGTSTFDGQAIAYSVLDYLVREVQCTSVFITHYPTLGEQLVAEFPHLVSNNRMSFYEQEGPDGRREIT